MADIYQSFLRSPSAAHLAPNASLHYITTTTSINQADAIIKHLQAQEKQVEKKSEDILSCIEGSNGVCLETETTFKFVRSGGVILPQMDDNMLADMEAVCPMVHIVQFDANRKISQIRLHWDQATMLKQVDAIGKSGRNWPIRIGRDQTKLIAQSVKSSPTDSSASSTMDQTQTSSATRKNQPLNSMTNVNNARRLEENDNHFSINKDARPSAAGSHQHVDGMTNVNNSRRQDENDNHFDINKDVSSAANENTDPNKTAKGKQAPRSDQVSSWSFADMQESPIKEAKIYKTYGDGMGGRAGSRLWDIASDDAPKEQYGSKGGDKQVYKTAGNGMGGRKGTGLSWSIGNEEDDA